VLPDAPPEGDLFAEALLDRADHWREEGGHPGPLQPPGQIDDRRVAGDPIRVRVERLQILAPRLLVPALPLERLRVEVPVFGIVRLLREKVSRGPKSGRSRILRPGANAAPTAFPRPPVLGGGELSPAGSLAPPNRGGRGTGEVPPWFPLPQYWGRGSGDGGLSHPAYCAGLITI
jgi:hypothetical protein